MEFANLIVEKRQEIIDNLHSIGNYLTYQDLLEFGLRVINTPYETPDPGRVHVINDGDYQGTLVFIIAEQGYQPSGYYYTSVYYGSCSYCDTLQGVLENKDKVTRNKELYTLILHMFQNMHKMEG